MPDVLCLGEILIDWVSSAPGAELDSANVFTKAPGGAPANVAVGLARQGISTSFIGRVANDAFGIWLKEILQSEGIDTSCTVIDETANTRMAYVVTTTSGDRKLAEFSRIACADAQLHESDLQPQLFKEASILHFGSISMISEPARSATRKAVELAKAAGLLVSYDPNVRLALWTTPADCRHMILETLSWADIVKINVDELEFLTGSCQLDAAEKLRRDHDLPLLVITLDAEGCHFVTEETCKTVTGFPIQVVEATGAGDGFVAGLLQGLLPYIRSATNRGDAVKSLSSDVFFKILRRANAIGAIACTKPGAIPALPSAAEVDSFINSQASCTSS